MLDGFRHLPGYLDETAQAALLGEVRRAMTAAPLYVPAMPRTGREMSVRMTNCGRLGWLTDKAKGYRYEARHPVTGLPWPPIPSLALRIWLDVAECPAAPEACLVNYYGPRARMGSHRDADEQDVAAPVVSISLGDDAVFHVGGLTRSEPRTRLRLGSGDVVVLGGKARLAYHGVDRILAGTSRLLAEGGRINLTLRRVTAMA
jgi:alkylated DNA repair protein (DNA oxidative demethylase)